jgi:hypothetical protein
MLKIVIGGLMILVGLSAFLRAISDSWREVLQQLFVLGATLLAVIGLLVILSALS